MKPLLLATARDARVITNMTILGSSTVLLDVKVVEIHKLSGPRSCTHDETPQMTEAPKLYTHFVCRDKIHVHIWVCAQF